MKKSITTILGILILSLGFVEAKEDGKKELCKIMHNFSADILPWVVKMAGAKTVGAKNETIAIVYQDNVSRRGMCYMDDMIAGYKGLTEYGGYEVLASNLGIEAKVQNLCTLDGVYRKGAATIYVQGGRTTTLIYQEGALTQVIQSLYRKPYEPADRLLHRLGQSTCMLGKILLQRSIGDAKVTAIYDDKHIQITKLDIPLRFDASTEKIKLDEKLSVSKDKLIKYLSVFYNSKVNSGEMEDNPIHYLNTILTNQDKVIEYAKEGYKIEMNTHKR